MSSWHSPQSIFNLGHKAVKDLLAFEVQVQEKIDGSFFAFGFYPEEYPDTPLKVRSKGAVMEPGAPMAMFKRAVQGVVAREGMLHPGWQYRGECLDKPKHNTLAYDRVPKDHVILFDILTDEENYLPYDQLVAEANRIGYDVVPQLFTGVIHNVDEVRGFLSMVSVLGGQQIEGVVIKPIVPLYGPDKKLLMGKFVSERFKEAHKVAWGESNPTSADIITKIVQAYGTQARWQKAVQHLKEAGLLENSPRDIGPLMQEVPKDVGMECKDEIKQALWKWAWPAISRQLARGLPEWYKDVLLEAAFEKEESLDKPNQT
jgi:hypothetical protein